IIWLVLGIGIAAFLFFYWTVFVFLYTFIVRLFIRNPPFADKDKYFPYGKTLEANWQTIRDELNAVLQAPGDIPEFHQLDKHQSRLGKAGGAKWKTFLFCGYGTWIEDNCARCPKTTALLKAEPRITSALFSILEPGKRLPAHFGPFKGVWRYHLALIVPSGAPCYIMVGGQRNDWKESEGTLFDDSFLHSAVNECDSRRAVLFVDVLRDDFPPLLDRINRGVYYCLGHSRQARQAIARARELARANA
ncbi:MAG: aspartyl/asparaginyl beta-hydroxylase domain-containing protein, partial [Fimbriimonadaceae bacterium]|nr:aspartyl/asparaginyl beta-hydroxylase domain-containing protein [Alphaproteobacteria bacterium]